MFLFPVILMYVFEDLEVFGHLHGPCEVFKFCRSIVYETESQVYTIHGLSVMSERKKS